MINNMIFVERGTHEKNNFVSNDAISSWLPE